MNSDWWGFLVNGYSCIHGDTEYGDASQCSEKGDNPCSIHEQSWKGLVPNGGGEVECNYTLLRFLCKRRMTEFFGLILPGWYICTEDVLVGFWLYFCGCPCVGMTTEGVMLSQQ